MTHEIPNLTPPTPDCGPVDGSDMPNEEELEEALIGAAREQIAKSRARQLNT